MIVDNSLIQSTDYNPYGSLARPLVYPVLWRES